MDIKEQMGRWCSISNTFSEFSFSFLSIGYNLQVIRSIVYFTRFHLLFFFPSFSHQKQNLLSKTLCSNPRKSIYTLKLVFKMQSHILGRMTETKISCSYFKGGKSDLLNEEKPSVFPSLQGRAEWNKNKSQTIHNSFKKHLRIDLIFFFKIEVSKYL